MRPYCTRLRTVPSLPHIIRVVVLTILLTSGVLSQGRPKYVNGRTRGRAGEVWLADGPFARADEQQLQASVRSTLDSSLRGNASAGTSRFSMRISLEAETNRRHACRDAGYRILLLTSTLYDTYMTPLCLYLTQISSRCGLG